MKTIYLKYTGPTKNKQKSYNSLMQFLMRQTYEIESVDYENLMIGMTNNIIKIQLPQLLTENNIFVLKKLNIKPL